MGVRVGRENRAWGGHTLGGAVWLWESKEPHLTFLLGFPAMTLAQKFSWAWSTLPSPCDQALILRSSFRNWVCLLAPRLFPFLDN